MKQTQQTINKNSFFYGIGAVGMTIIDTFLGSFLTLYATDVLGIDALRFAALLLAPKIFDVLIDFFIMFFLSKTRSRFGMYRPWLLNMVAMVVALITIFSVPFFNFSKSLLLIVVTIAYFISFSLCGSLYWIPYKALPGVITENEDELIKYSSFKSIFEYVFSTLSTAVTMPILLAFGRYDGDYRNPKAWLIVALIFGIVSLITSILCFCFVRTDFDLEKKMSKDFSLKDIFSDYRYVLSDKFFIEVTLTLTLIYIGIYANQTVSYYFCIYNLNLENLFSIIYLIGTVVTAITSLLIGKLYKKFDLKNSLIIGIIALIISAVLKMFSYNALMVIVAGGILAFGSTVLTTLIFSLWPIVAKNMNSEKVKSPLNSTIGASNVFESFSIILGNTIGAAIITYSQYDPNLITQNSFTLNVFRYATPAFVIILSIIVIAVVSNSIKKEVIY